MKRFFSFVLIASVILGCNAANALEGSLDWVLPAPDLVWSLEHASQVARVRITARQPVRADPLNFARVCGYVLTAKVEQAFKGASTSFQFLSSVNDDFSGFDHDYFVIVFSHERIGPETFLALSALAKSEVADEARCLLSQTSYVPAAYQTIWSFSPAAGRSLRGDWLRVANRQDAIFCGYGADQVHQTSIRVRMVKQNGTDAQETVFSWNDLRGIITNILAHASNLQPCTIK